MSCIKGSSVVFDEQLLSHIRCSRNDEAKSMITRDLANTSDGFGTLLHYAAMYGNATITRYLIELGWEIDFPGQDGKTPLMLSVTGECTAAMKALLNADADIDTVDDDGQSALQMAFNRDYVNYNIIKPFARKLQTITRTTRELGERLMAAGGNMYHAAGLRNFKILECLRARGVNVDSKAPNGATGLHVAAELKLEHVARWFLIYGADVNALDNRGDSALHVSANNGSREVMSILLEHGADFNLKRCRDGCTPVDVASNKIKSGKQFVECLKLLRQHGATITSLHIAFTFDEELLSKIRYDYYLTRSQLIDAPVEISDDERTLLHHAAKHGNARAAKLLIDLGSKVDAFVSGRTPLMLAVQEEQVVTIEVLLQANPNSDLTDDEGRSAVAMALECWFFRSGTRAFIRKWLADNLTMEEIAEILIAAGANMHHAVVSKNVELMECMLERGIHIDSRGHCDKTGLHVAIGWHDANSAEWLIYHGADTNAVDEYGDSRLHMAVINRSKDMLKILLERGADPNLKNRFYYCTPLFTHLHRRYSKFDLADVERLELLLRYDAVPCNSIRIRGTVLDHILAWLNDKVTRILITHLALLQKRGVAVTKSVMRYEDPTRLPKMAEFVTFYETCLRTLETTGFRKLTLSDLLHGSEGRLQQLVRNERFVSEVRQVCELSELNSYYCKRVMERVDRAIRVVMLKNEAIRVVCKLFDGNYDECYIFARIVVDYLEVHDLEKLLAMGKTLQLEIAITFSA